MPSLFLSLVLFVGAADPDPLRDYQRESLPTGQLYWRGWGEADRREIARRIPDILADVERRLGRRKRGAFDVVLASDGFEFSRVVKALSGYEPDGETVSGVAVPALHLLVLRGGYALHGGGFRETLVHEVAHLVIHAAARPVPRWLDEGVATWVSGHALTPKEDAYIAFLARTQGLYSLTQIEDRFPGGHLPTSVAYQQSLLFLNYLVEVHGVSVVARLLDLGEEGLDTREIVQALARAPLSSVEEGFKRWLLSRVPFGTMVFFLMNVWTICALLALVAIARFLVKRRRRLRELTLQELDSSQPDAADRADSPEL